MHLLLSILLAVPDSTAIQEKNRTGVWVEARPIDRNTGGSSNIYLLFGPQFIKPMAGVGQIDNSPSFGFCIGMMWRDKNRFFHPYFLAEVSTMDSSDGYPIIYRDGNREISTTAHLLTNVSSLRLGLSADFPVKGPWIPRIFMEAGHTTVHSSIRIPRPNPGPDDSSYFINRRAIHKDRALGFGGGMAMRREFYHRDDPSTIFYIDLSASFWQTGRIEYLHSDRHLAQAISQNGEESYAGILSDRPHFTSYYYEGYRYKTPLDHLTFRITVGVNF